MSIILKNIDLKPHQHDYWTSCVQGHVHMQIPTWPPNRRFGRSCVDLECRCPIFKSWPSLRPSKVHSPTCTYMCAHTHAYALAHNACACVSTCTCARSVRALYLLVSNIWTFAQKSKGSKDLEPQQMILSEAQSIICWGSKVLLQRDCVDTHELRSCVSTQSLTRELIWTPNSKSATSAKRI